MIQTVTARHFNQDASGVKRAANDGPVIITERGKPAHVLMTIAQYEALQRQQKQMPLLPFLESLDLKSLDTTRSPDQGRDDPF